MLLKSSTTWNDRATVNVSGPKHVTQAFNVAFQVRNKSAVPMQLMREAIARAQEHWRRKGAAQRNLVRWSKGPGFTAAELDTARRS